jgi:predicted regulator of Ras-like GTPase activity (Roadblock/LC7/MglB family)
VTESKTQKLDQRLRELQASASGIIASSLVSSDGLTITSVMPQDIEEARVAAMAAAMLSLGDKISMELGRGDMDEFYIKGDQGFVLLTSVGDDAVLTALVTEKAKLGLIFLELRRTAKDLLKIIE